MLPTPQSARAPARTRGLDAEDVRARANKLLDGEEGFFTINPWERVRVLDVTASAFPVGVEVAAVDVIIGGGIVGGSRIGLLWDDAQTLELPPQQVNAGEVLALRVEARRGQRLEVWADDAEEVGSVQLVAAARLEERAEERDRQKKAAEDEDNPLTSGIKEIASTTRLFIGIALVGVIVIGFAIAKGWNGQVPSPSVGG